MLGSHKAQCTQRVRSYANDAFNRLKDGLATETDAASPPISSASR
jgi:hypothetical protein